MIEQILFQHINMFNDIHHCTKLIISSNSTKLQFMETIIQNMIQNSISDAKTSFGFHLVLNFPSNPPD